MMRDILLHLQKRPYLNHLVTLFTVRSVRVCLLIMLTEAS